jgi:gas vesicle structural protein
MTELIYKEREVTLVELLDRVVNKGVYIWGDITLSVADVDLVYLGLKVMLCSIEKAIEMRQLATQQPDEDTGLGG